MPSVKSFMLWIIPGTDNGEDSEGGEHGTVHRPTNADVVVMDMQE